MKGSGRNIIPLFNYCMEFNLEKSENYALVDQWDIVVGIIRIPKGIFDISTKIRKAISDYSKSKVSIHNRNKSIKDVYINYEHPIIHTENFRFHITYDNIKIHSEDSFDLIKVSSY